ncbi:MAG: endonuclease/exonuclease/phosphatase family protein [Actinomycetota bacterium]
MRVMTWNLWWRFGDHERRSAAIDAVLRAEAPDVVCFQEVWSDATTDQAEMLAARHDAHVVRTEPVLFDGFSFGNAIMARWPIERIADVRLPGADGEPGYRRLLIAAVATPWGSWPIAATHLDYRFDASHTRQHQVRRVLECVVEHRGDPEHDLPMIVGGDLNAVADSDEMRIFTGRRPGVDGIVMSDVWEQVGDGPGNTWRRDNPHVAESAWPERRIDYLGISWPRPKPVGNPIRAWLAGTSPVDTDDGPVWPSDHAAVVAELVVPSSPSDV